MAALTPESPDKSRVFALHTPNRLLYSASAYLRSFAGVSVKEMKMPEHRSESGFVYGLTNLKPVQPHRITVTFPDGAKREFPQNTTGLDIARGISPSLAKRTVAMVLNGTLSDLADP